MTLDEALEIIAAQRVQIVQQQMQIAVLQARIDELERRLNRDSNNSHKPPSSDPPWGKGPKKIISRKERRRRRGTHRVLVDVSQVDHVVRLAPATCDRCGKGLQDTEAESTQRHQVVELPEVKAQITEYQLAAHRCERCATVTRASLPAGAGQSPFGPRLMATVAMLAVGYRLSKRQIKTLLEEQWGVEISLGGISAIEARLAAAAQDPYDEARAFVTHAPVVAADETPWYERHRLGWLWTASTPLVTAYRIHPQRTTAAAQELLPKDFAGTATADRYAAYNYLSWTQRQVCWAHLRREFVEISESKEPVARHVGARALALIHEIFVIWRQFQSGRYDRHEFVKVISPTCRQLHDVIELGAHASHPWTRSRCKSIFASREGFFHFVSVDGVEPTNNRAERALRCAVIYRRLSLGTQSDRGSRFVERMLTIVQSLRAQSRDLFAYLVKLANCALIHRPAPSLLPLPAAT